MNSRHQELEDRLVRFAVEIIRSTDKLPARKAGSLLEVN